MIVSSKFSIDVMLRIRMLILHNTQQTTCFLSKDYINFDKMIRLLQGKYNLFINSLSICIYLRRAYISEAILCWYVLESSWSPTTPQNIPKGFLGSGAQILFTVPSISTIAGIIVNNIRNTNKVIGILRVENLSLYPVSFFFIQSCFTWPGSVKMSPNASFLW